MWSAKLSSIFRRILTRVCRLIFILREREKEKDQLLSVCMGECSNPLSHPGQGSCSFSITKDDEVYPPHVSGGFFFFLPEVTLPPSPTTRHFFVVVGPVYKSQPAILREEIEDDGSLAAGWFRFPQMQLIIIAQSLISLSVGIYFSMMTCTQRHPASSWVPLFFSLNCLKPA